MQQRFEISGLGATFGTGGGVPNQGLRQEWGMIWKRTSFVEHLLRKVSRSGEVRSEEVHRGEV